MHDYIRLVSYLYTYEEGKKRNNVGYVKVESRNGQCKFTIHASALSYGNSKVTIYTFLENKHPMKGIRLGEGEFRGGILDLKITTSASNILDTNLSVEELQGVVIYVGSSKYVGAGFDVDLISQDEVINMVHKANQKQSSTLVKGKQEEIRRLETKREEEKKEQIRREEARLKQEKLEQERLEQQRLQEMKQLSSIGTSSQQGENPSSLIEEITNNLKIGSEEQLELHNLEKELKAASFAALKEPNEIFEQYDRFNKRVHEFPQKNGKTIPFRETPTEEKFQNSNDSIGYNFKQSGDEPIIAQKFHEEYPIIYPFEDKEIMWCVSITPHDIGRLPLETWPLSGNSFLNHGYYGYEHIIFAKVSSDVGNYYVLGVPGLFKERERFFARLFGFSDFKSAVSRQYSDKEFGYWLLPVRLS